MMAALARRLEELVGAFMLLTRLPVARLSRGAMPPEACVWAYPVVGAAVGAIGGAAFWAGSAAGLPAIAASVWSVAAMVLATGGLHEDGLADTADGLGGGRTRGAKLAIMRDSRIGAFGAIALILSLMLRVIALAAMVEPSRVGIALVGAAVAGRGAMIGVLIALRPARPDGMAAVLGATDPRAAVAGLVLAGTVLLLPGGVAAAMAAAVAAAALARVARRQIGGYTGDVLGAVEQLAECAALSALLARTG